MISTQMLKGTLEGCVLAIISKEETYGYEISLSLEKYGFGKITEGTIYPMLLRLEKNEYITSVLKASAVGPKRKYYHITDKGKEYLKQYFIDMNELINAITTLKEELDHNEFR